MDRFDFSVVSKIDDPNEATRALLESLSTLLNQNCPVKKIKMNDKCVPNEPTPCVPNDQAAPQKEIEALEI